MRHLWTILLILELLPAARAELQLFVVEGAIEKPVPPLYSLGTVYPGDIAQVHFRLRNAAAAPESLNYLEVRGTGFGPKNPLDLPMTLAAQAAADFTVSFRAPEFGSYAAILDSEGISVMLIVTVPAAPPLPPPRLTIVLPRLRSAEQGSVTVMLDAPASRTANGSVTLDFQPGPEGASDPAIVFSSGARTAAFTCDAGTTSCRFGDQPSAPFQAGTTAGLLTFAARFGSTVSDPNTVTIPAQPVSIVSAQGSRLSDRLELQITGFDNTRTAGLLAFTFFDPAGNPLAPGIIPADARTAFRQLYKTSDAGGAFVLRAVFPVTGDPSRIAAFAAGIGNSEGVATSPRTKF